jgi:ribosome biogenesis GTPase
MAKKKKVRVDLRKNRNKPARERGWTRGFQEHGYQEEAPLQDERVKAKGDLSRRRTITQDENKDEPAGTEAADMPTANAVDCRPGRVIRVHGLHSIVETEDRKQHRCAVRRLLKSLSTDERSIVTTGDRVWFRAANEGEGLIESVEPRHGLLTRASRKRQHVLVANVDQVVFVVSLVEPDLKPHLIDRYLASAEMGGITPLICLNKADLVDAAAYQEIVGYYSQLGISMLLTSAKTGQGIDELRDRLRDRETVFSGQSGVGKSSLLNSIQPGLGLRVREISDVNQKGRHTTTTAELIRLDLPRSDGAAADAMDTGWVVDTPGIRQFELWDIRPEEVEGFFPEFRPFVPLCAFPDCTHTHEDHCAVKRAVVRALISDSRYTSYLGLFAGEPAD